MMNQKQNYFKDFDFKIVEKSTHTLKKTKQIYYRLENESKTEHYVETLKLEYSKSEERYKEIIN